MSRFLSNNAGAGKSRRWWVGAIFFLLPLPCARARQSALNPVSEHAEDIAVLWWIFFTGATAIFVAVMFLLGIGLWRARNREESGLSHAASRNLVIAAGVAIPLAILVTLVGGSLFLGRSVAAKPPDNALRISITGWMWWWEVEYLDQAGQPIATTANELHIPVGQPVELLLTSADVIHSFWVPPLHGKTDLLPGDINRIWFTADKPGTYRGQCAEFCGLQHARMAFLVIAESQAAFRTWLAQQAEPAAAPESTQLQQGLDVFLTSGCATCHTVRGTPASGDLAPDLTHLATRRTLAALTIPNTRGHLGGWISDPHGVKPGVFMPRTLLAPEELTALTAYLESLR
jgi:cytochrome c oxidase subunit II